MTYDRLAILQRAGFQCEYCRTQDGKALGMWSVHHRKPRAMGGTKKASINNPQNLLLLCGSGTTGCHGYFESHRQEAYEHKVILRNWEDIQDQPFRDKIGTWWRLDNNYGKVRLGYEPQFR